MKLYELIKGIAETKLENIEISSITDNTKKVENSCIFVCIKGEKFDGHTMALNAIENGAVLVFTEKDLGLGDKQIVTTNTRIAYGKLCAAWFNNPQNEMTLVGVTGTNGKTTITSVIKEILTSVGYKVGLIGTIQNEIGDEALPTGNTTPLTFDFMKILRQMADAGCQYVVMEVSSFGLVQRRIGPVHFKAALFTNLTQDHLDYHGTMENYYQAKKMLFDICDIGIFNIDDEYSQRMVNEVSCQKFTYSSHQKADYYADVVKLKADGTSFWLCENGRSHNVSMNMIGQFNVANVTGAVAICLNLGVQIEDILDCISQLNGVKGRCEIIPTGKDFTVICDYAHTPDALVNILSNVKEYTTGRLICLFGCGGNRDKTKRPKMAEAAAEYSDFLMVTSDNPRDEEPMDIINDILEGIKGKDIEYNVESDRREAIYKTLKLAKSGDIIVLAGKGHEDYQVLKDNVHIHFDEREVVVDGLKLL